MRKAASSLHVHFAIRISKFEIYLRLFADFPIAVKIASRAARRLLSSAPAPRYRSSLLCPLVIPSRLVLQFEIRNSKFEMHVSQTGRCEDLLAFATSDLDDRTNSIVAPLVLSNRNWFNPTVGRSPQGPQEFCTRTRRWLIELRGDNKEIKIAVRPTLSTSPRSEQYRTACGNACTPNSHEVMLDARHNCRVNHSKNSPARLNSACATSTETAGIAGSW